APAERIGLRMRERHSHGAQRARYDLSHPARAGARDRRGARPMIAAVLLFFMSYSIRRRKETLFGQIELTSAHAQDAVALGRQRAHQRRAGALEHLLSRLGEPTRDGGSMRAVERAELVQGQAIEIVLAEQVLLPRGQRVQGFGEGLAKRQPAALPDGV